MADTRPLEPHPLRALLAALYRLLCTSAGTGLPQLMQHWFPDWFRQMDRGAVPTPELPKVPISAEQTVV